MQLFACILDVYKRQPLGSVIDGAVAASICDGAVIVIESGSVSYKFVQNIKEQLGKVNCHVLGCVLNKVDMSRTHYYGKYYEKYYGGYYAGYYGNTEGELPLMLEHTEKKDCVKKVSGTENVQNKQDAKQEEQR